MDGSRGGGRRVEKRGYEGRVEDEEDNDGMPQSKKPKIPGLASVIVEALKVDSLQRLCSSLEPLFRRIVSEEVERALTRFGHGQIAGRSSPPRIQGSEGKVLQLQFRMRMPPHLFTGGKVEGEQGAAIHVVLLDATTGNVVQTGPESSSKLNVVVLEGDFNEELDENWSADHFESHEVKAREGKRPLLTGELQVTLNEGVGTLGDLSFTDNSSWIRSRKFRLGLKVASGFCVGIRIREAKTEAFAVKDHRGELYKKHYPPALHDEVWRLDRIAKDGALHKKLMKSEVITVEDFLRVLVKDPQKLRNILGSGMSNRMWENTVEHAKTCVLGGKLYVYYADLAHTTGAIFNHIYELRGLIADGQFVPLESLNHDQKISVDSLVKRAYENWNRVVEYDGKVLTALTVPAPPAQNLIEYPFISSDPMVGVSSHTHHQSVPSDYRPAGPSTFDVSGDWSSPSPHGYGDSFSEEVRLRSSEMLETDDMQKLLRSFGVGETGPTFGLYENGSYGYNIPHEPHISPVYAHGHRRGSGKAVVGWLKLKAALRWGIFIRKKAAERRAQLIELD
ncbi:calmodulin-binding protein 60 E-like isoform X2 [Cynara cardunculus var. scolymus]|uniref:calmodulin-binding protein 60 E-like isoform X2 n=1 Tax=Cynara cardunculus var. scolymus TaxID=59895 RepID=UPI000D628205|nr:calmodulin-binding protein 60 E-like isoform X2 [Cynara cardunculus var. scolymus]